MTPGAALPFASVEPIFDGVDHDRGERDFLVEGVLADPLVKIDWEVDRSLAKAFAQIGIVGRWRPPAEPVTR